MKASIKTSWLGRTRSVSRLAFDGAAYAIKTKLKSGQAQQADMPDDLARLLVTVRDELGAMKGLVMKAGQMASYLAGVLPEEAQEVLQSLQDSTTPMTFDKVRDIVEHELGRPLDAVFADFEPLPLAAASIGQVHVARLLSGEAVAVKVQYPEIAKAIESDLANADLLRPLFALFFRGADTSAVLEELRARSLEECDYLGEAENQETFRKLFAGRSDVIIPRVYRELSTKRVLVTELVEGMRFREFLMRSTQAERDAAGATIARVAFESIFHHRMFNADPHPGNYLFQDGKVVFLDYGCVRRWDDAFIKRWRTMVRAAIEGDKETFCRLWRELGMVGNEEAFDYDRQYEDYRTMLQFVIIGEPYRVTRAAVQAEQEILTKNNKNLRVSNLPPEFVLVTRLNFGLTSILAALNARANWRQIVDDAMLKEPS